MIELREWQKEALNEINTIIEKGESDALIASAPASGKTIFACSVSQNLIEKLNISKIVVVSPSENVRDNWQDSMAKFGFQLKTGPHYPYDRDYSDYQGISITYQWMAANETYLRAYSDENTIVILDEVHHCGDERSWGDACFNSFEGAMFRLLLSGTPWRSEGNKIPFVDYDQQGYCKPAYSYTIGSAVSDRVCQKLEISKIDVYGNAKMNGEVTHFESFEHAKKENKENEFYRYATDNEEIFCKLFADADQKLNQLRKNEHKDAGGMIIAKDKSTADKYADWLLLNFNQESVVVHSGMAKAHQIINQFKRGSDKWLISVDMIGEGTDIPRLQVELYLHLKKESMSLYQYWMRVARVRSRQSEKIEHCYIYTMAHSKIIEVAKKIEQEIKIKLKEKEKTKDVSPPEGGGEVFRNYGELVDVGFNGEILTSGGHQFTKEELEEARPIYNKVSGEIPLSVICKVIKTQKDSSPEPPKPETEAPPLEVQKKSLRKRIQQTVGRIAYINATRENLKSPDSRHYKEVWNLVNSRCGITRSETATLDDLRCMLDFASALQGETA
jgi:superfamily II DNA or RNA helicase